MLLQGLCGPHADDPHSESWYVLQFFCTPSPNTLQFVHGLHTPSWSLALLSRNWFCPHFVYGRHLVSLRFPHPPAYVSDDVHVQLFCDQNNIRQTSNKHQTNINPITHMNQTTQIAKPTEHCRHLLISFSVPLHSDERYVPPGHWPSPRHLEHPCATSSTYARPVHCSVVM